MGPSNFLGGAYMQHPVAITVEGANILTRSLIIFGQGAIRCHPYLLKEMNATREPRPRRGVDRVRRGAVRATCASRCRNLARTFVMGLTGLALRARAAPTWRRRRAATTSSSRASRRRSRSWPTCRWARSAARSSARRSCPRGWATSSRSCTCARPRCAATRREGRQAADAPLMHWAIWDAMFKAQNAFEGVISNFPNRVRRRARAAHRVPARPSVRRAVGPARPRGGAPPDRAVGHARPADRRHVHRREDEDDPVALIERALDGDDGGRADPGAGSARRSRKARSTARVAPDAGVRRARAARRGGRRHRRRRGARARQASRARRAGDRASTTSTRDLGASLLRARASRRCERQSRRGARARRRMKTIRWTSPSTSSTARARRSSRRATGRGRSRRPTSPPTPAARCCCASAFAADAARRGDPRLRGAVGRRGQHRPRRRAAHGMRPEGAGLDGDAQLRVGHAVDRFGDQQHPRGTLEPRARRRRGCAVARAAAVLRRDGRVAVEVVRGEERGPARGAARASSARATSRRSSRS